MNGIIVVNKPKGITSRDVVNKVCKILNTKKIGHTGTLDPIASGTLVLCIGNATKLVEELTSYDKEYIATVKLGVLTDTLDITGNILKEGKKNFSKDEIINALNHFKGTYNQEVPIYSAIKINGKKLYEYARKGQEVELKPRRIEIYSIQLVGINEKEKQISFKVKCSKGTYIRSLCEDISKKLGTVGYMKELNRLQVGVFFIKDAVTISEMKEEIEADNLENIITIEEIFKDKSQIKLTQKQLEQYMNGVKIDTEKEDGIYRIYKIDNIFIGLGIVENNKLKRDVVI